MTADESEEKGSVSSDGISNPLKLVQTFGAMTRTEKKVAAQGLQTTEPGLFDLDPMTRRVIWAAVFTVLLVIAIGALAVIWHSYTVDLKTTTVVGKTTTTSVTHPDVSAAWAVVSAVIAGIVGLLVPSPASTKT